MTISSLAMTAKKVIDAEWLNGPAYDLSTQAVEALESAQLLQSPETAAETERLRKQVAELKAQREALASRLRAGQRWQRGRRPALVSEDFVSQDELRAMFGIPLTAPWNEAQAPTADESADKLTRLLAPTPALREDPHDGGPLHHLYPVPRDLPETGGTR